MTENLVQHRSGASVWDRRARLDAERWLSITVAAACLGIGARTRSRAGLCLVIAGAAVAWWAAGDPTERVARRSALSSRRRRRADAFVDEASADSFPASDAAAFSGRPEGTGG